MTVGRLRLHQGWTVSPAQPRNQDIPRGCIKLTQEGQCAFLHFDKRARLPLRSPLPPPPSAFAADTYRIVHTYPHDPQAYTQGLLFEDGHLYESTGLNGRSSLRMVDLETGRVLQ